MTPKVFDALCQRQLENEIPQARNEGDFAGKTKAEIYARLAQATQSYGDIATLRSMPRSML
ncbi:hypothetical protein [Duganella levis]|uniref:Uncharacterized protein n=1 Tax=Duganella levis TaxID=2692169 RepID=A0ABW9W5C6_9BURK|nr:hypothetical protein [Duganella levis]MYN28785.1 hypothetical protein [Duganella levis]